MGEKQTPQLKLYLLGPPHIELNGQAIDFSRRKAIALLVYLAVTNAPTGHSRDALATLFWPESDQSQARAALRRALSELNTSLPGNWLNADRETIGVNNIWLDTQEFTNLIEQGHLEEAERLYQDDFMAGFTLRDCPEFDEWQFFQTESLRQNLNKILEQLVRHYIDQTRYEPAIAYARRWLSHDTLNENAHRYLMLLYAHTGQRNAALRQYQECVRILDEELGVAPSDETETLYQTIRSGELDQAEESDETKGQEDETISLPPYVIAPASRQLPSPPPLPFVAREEELARLNRYLAKALEGQGQMVCITGEAGTGKTALVQAFARQAETTYPQVVVLTGTCNAYTGQGDPYLPFREMLSLLNGDVEIQIARGLITPENVQRLWQLMPTTLKTIAGSGPALIDTLVPAATLKRRAKTLGQTNGFDKPQPQPPAQSDLFDQFTAVLQILAQERPLLLIVDDAQWADTASINLLFHLSRRLAGSRMLLMVTYRPDDVALGRGGQRHPLEPVINEVKRNYGDIQIDLTHAPGRAFVEALIDTQPNRLSPEFRDALLAKTEGHPLFTVELLRTMQERQDITKNEMGQWIESDTLDWNLLPARIEAVIEERVSRLDHNLRELLSVASVQGEIFTAQVIAQVQQADERQVLRQVAQVLERGHHLVSECCETNIEGRFLADYSFRHTLFQQYLYNSLSTGERRLLHRDIAAVLEDIYDGQTEEITVQLAHHYSRAGQSEKAIDYLLQAGDKARTMYAHQEAVDFYQQALTFQKEQGAYDKASRTLMKLGLTHHQAFNFAQARQAYSEGFTLWQQASNQASAQLPPAPHPLRVVSHPLGTLDPTLCLDDNAGKIIFQLFSGLVSLNPDMDVIPDVAESWEVQAGGRRYLFHLQENIFWSDGIPLTAHDFEYAWKRVLNPATESPTAAYLFDIKGAKAFNNGDASDPNQLGVQALNDHTLLVELEGPTSYFPQLLTQWVSFPVPRHVVEKHGAAWTQPEFLVTNGPFLLSRWQPDLMILERNPTYRGQFSGNVHQVEIHIGADLANEQEGLYEADKLDIMGFHALSKFGGDARQRYAAEYLSTPALSTQYIGFNTSKPPFDDPRVRQAFVMAADRDTLANVNLKGFFHPAHGGFVPPGMPGYSPDIGLPYDPEQAKDLLAQAGYETKTLLGGVYKSPQHIMTSYLNRQWLQNLGVEVIWEDIEWNRIFDRLYHDPPHMYRMGWALDYPDPDNILRMGTPIESWTGWRNQTYTALLEEARQTTNQSRRIKLYQQADKILVQEAAIMPLTYGRGHYLIKPWISKYPTSPINRYQWKDVVIDPH